MAFTCGFFNSVAHDRKYDAVQHGMIFDGIITDGIYATYLKAMVVKASENASEVIVQPGRAWFNHTWSYNDSDYPVAAPEPEVVLDRIDTLVLDINSEDAVRNNQFLWVQGTPTSQIPEPPTLIHTVTHNQYPLCDVYRKAGTTMIYAADITNRVGTSDCPFVTGVLESINIDDLLAQWDDEFHTWENATKASFEGWMLNQQQVYTAWFNALKTQMAGDVADVEAWVQTIKDIIDEETATHLQLEIDEINSMLPSGSHITVTTTDTELYSRAVTITDEDNNTVTSQFDATGVAVFKSVPYVGNLTIEATDGIRTATSVVNTPYFARYEFPLAFWSATLSFNLDSAFGGSVVTIEDSLGTTIGTVTLNGSGDGTFDVGSAGTYTCSMVYGGQTMTQSVNVTQETTYSVSFSPTGSTVTPTDDIQIWLHCAGIYDKTYTTLDEVLADNTTLLALISDNNAVDYMVRSTDWVGNNWALVPTMTSNTTPSGECIGYKTATSDSAGGGYPYRAFDGDTTTMAGWQSYNPKSDLYIGYDFGESVSIKSYKIKEGTNNRMPSATLKGSNDGSTWTVIDNWTSAYNDNIKELSDVATYRYFAVFLTDEGAGGSSGIAISTIQFWGAPGIVDNQTAMGYIGNNDYAADTLLADATWLEAICNSEYFESVLNVKVPTMTSNTAPSGVASGNGRYSGGAFFNSFDGHFDYTNKQQPYPPYLFDREKYPDNQGYVTYEFTAPMRVNLVKFKSVHGYGPSTSNTYQCKGLEILGSNDGINYTAIITIDTSSQEEASIKYSTIMNNVKYTYYKTFPRSGYYAGVRLQFYGRA